MMRAAHRYSDEQVARVCHEANRELQRLQGDPVPSAPWDCEPEEIRQSAVDGVCNARRGCTPRESHENWVQFKLAHGWAYGPEKDPEGKTHPCMVPYEDLPAGQRDKDRLFLFIVTALTDVAPELSSGEICVPACGGMVSWLALRVSSESRSMIAAGYGLRSKGKQAAPLPGKPDADGVPDKDG